MRVHGPVSRMSPKPGGLRSWVAWEVLGPHTRRAQVCGWQANSASALEPLSRSIARSVLPIPEGFGIERARGRRDEPKDG